MPTHPTLVARIPAFLHNRRQDVITMLDALARGFFETVERLGHSMKGAGASFGFQAVSDIGAALERAAGSADTNASRKLVGELSTYLDRVGNGAEFTARLPLSDGREVTADTRFNGALRDATINRRVVVVDDDEDQRMLMKEILESWGHAVEVAADGVKGSALILSSLPDIAFIDLRMPGLDGFQVAQSVRASPDSAITRLIAVTGFDDAGTCTRALAAGFDQLLVKPPSLEDLEQVLAKRLS